MHRAQHHEHHRLCVSFEALESGRKPAASCVSWPPAFLPTSSMPWRTAQHHEHHRLWVSFETPESGRKAPASYTSSPLRLFLRPQSLAGHAHHGPHVDLQISISLRRRRRVQHRENHRVCCLFEAPDSCRNFQISMPWRRAQHHEHHCLCVSFEAPESGRKPQHHAHHGPYS